MTPDSWTRLPVPYGPGYNHAPAAVQPIEVAYDAATDELVFTSLMPIMNNLDEVSMTGMLPSGSASSWAVTGSVGAGTLYVVSSTEARLLGAWTEISNTQGSDPSVLHVDFYDAGPTLMGTWVGNVLVTEPVPLTYPLLTGICSPAADTVRFEGSRFLTATAGAVGSVVSRLVDYTADSTLNGGSMGYDLTDGSPDGNDWSLISHTDTVIEISNPRFTSSEPQAGPGDFVVNGVAFHSADYVGMYYYEPWGDPSPYSAAIDGAGC